MIASRFALLGLIATLGPLTQSSAPIAVDAQQVGSNLVIRVLGRSMIPVLLTFRTTVGVYFDVDIRDEKGTRIKYLGPTVMSSKPELWDLHLLTEGEFFGSLVSLRSDHGFMLEPGKKYTCVVTYVDRDTKWALSKSQAARIRKLRPFIELEQRVKSPPVSLRVD